MIDKAASLPSLIAQTTKDAPLTISPAAKTPLILVSIVSKSVLIVPHFVTCNSCASNNNGKFSGSNPKALGFDPENLPLLFEAQELQVTKWGTIKTDFDTMETNIKGVFAAGDIVRGASLVVWAIKDGRDAALSIKSYLENIELKKSKVA